MNEFLTHLQQRNSAPRLTAPGPDASELQHLLRAAVRAPDHAWLQPWRFTIIQGDARKRLGQVFLQDLMARDPASTAEARDKAIAAPLRAPLLIVVSCRVQEHPKVPREEQLLSAGCAAQNILLGAEALGYGGVWRTGGYAESARVKAALELVDKEEIVAFLYLGTRDGKSKPLPHRELENYVRHWD